jgi:hypothetical protein
MEMELTTNMTDAQLLERVVEIVNHESIGDELKVAIIRGLVNPAH